MKTDICHQKTQLQEAMTTGVFVEFCNEDGEGVAQVVYTSWKGQPIPVPGDSLLCTVPADSSSQSNSGQKISGKVLQRQYEVDVNEDDETSVWVHLLVETQMKVRVASRESGVQTRQNEYCMN